MTAPEWFPLFARGNEAAEDLYRRTQEYVRVVTARAVAAETALEGVLAALSSLAAEQEENVRVFATIEAEMAAKGYYGTNVTGAKGTAAACARDLRAILARTDSSQPARTTPNATEAPRSEARSETNPNTETTHERS